MRTESLVAVLGVVAVLGGLAALAGFVVPGLSATFAFVLAVGLLAGAQGLRYALDRRNVDYRATDAGDPELRYRVPTPGDDADARLSRSGGWGTAGASNVRGRLRDAAAESLVLHDNCSREAAEDHLERGTWTDDPVAARYLGADVPLSLATRVRLVLRGRASTPARVARTVAAVEAIHESDSTAARRTESAENAESAAETATAPTTAQAEGDG